MAAMFETAELDHRVDREEYAERVTPLRAALTRAQIAFLSDARASLVIVVAGVDGAGKGDTVNQLNAWLDPRHVRTHGMGRPSDEERERPYLWRFWRRLPPKGSTAVFFGSWYTQPILARAYGTIDDGRLDQELDRIRRFEQMLTDEGVILLKLWFHLSKKQQKKRLKRLATSKRTRWRVTETDWKHYELYDEFVPICARSLRRTSTDNAPWLVVAGADARYRELTVGHATRDALEGAPAVPETPPEIALRPRPRVDGTLMLHALDLTKRLGKKAYGRRLERLQGRINLLLRDEALAARSLVVVFEGVDAAGKGGAIRRLTASLDARSYRVVPVAAPSDEERARPYLWRFFRHVPGHGKVVIFDRSWYGRVLVERVESLCEPSDWMRAYGEINDFEEQLVRNGTIVVKLWLHIDADEQLSRFEARAATPFKQHKITEEDWRNRERWGDYEIAVEDMIERTSTEIAPWTLVEANDKNHARVKVLRTVADALEAAR